MIRKIQTVKVWESLARFWENLTCLTKIIPTRLFKNAHRNCFMQLSLSGISHTINAWAELVREIANDLFLEAENMIF